MDLFMRFPELRKVLRQLRQPQARSCRTVVLHQLRRPEHGKFLFGMRKQKTAIKTAIKTMGAVR